MKFFKNNVPATVLLLSTLACGSPPHGNTADLVTEGVRLYAYKVDVAVPGGFLGLGTKNEQGWCVLAQRGGGKIELLTSAGSLDDVQIRMLVRTGYFVSESDDVQTREVRTGMHSKAWVSVESALGLGENQKTVFLLARSPGSALRQVESFITELRLRALLDEDDEQVGLKPRRVRNMMAELQQVQIKEKHLGKCHVQPPSQ